MSDTSTPIRIEIPGDVLIEDREFCDTVLGGATTRTGQRYDKQGLPYVMIAGRKWRPINAGREWLKQQIVRQGAKHKR